MFLFFKWTPSQSIMVSNSCCCYFFLSNNISTHLSQPSSSFPRTSLPFISFFIPFSITFPSYLSSSFFLSHLFLFLKIIFFGKFTFNVQIFFIQKIFHHVIEKCVWIHTSNNVYKPLSWNNFHHPTTYPSFHHLSIFFHQSTIHQSNIFFLIHS